MPRSYPQGGSMGPAALLAQLNEIDLSLDAARARLNEIAHALAKPAALAAAQAALAAAQAR